jgi:hypothetical protein
MTPERQEQLTKDFPKIFGNTKKTPKESAMAFGISTGDGWYWIINHLCRALQGRTDEFGEPQIVASQVKEKFGGLRFYVNGASDEQYSLIHFTESLSYSVCEECGTMDKVSLRKDGWIMTLCDTCDEKRKDG